MQIKKYINEQSIIKIFVCLKIIIKKIIINNQKVLSVIAQQILTIQSALFKFSQVKNPPSSFAFEGDPAVPLDASCAIFVTMNPGYKGRTELPDNLKVLFRPVAMMIPNYARITEISLYSYGYMHARKLARKVIAALRLASEQLSS